MPQAAQSATTLRFGVFELDLRAGELRKQGLKVRLQERPLQILALLLENPGEVVTRAELRQHLWPADTFVDFDHSVNTAINKLREALGDSAENPRFIETLPRHGYRFIGHAEPLRSVHAPPIAEESQLAPGEPGLGLVPARWPGDLAPVTAGRPPMTVLIRPRQRGFLYMAGALVAALALVVAVEFDVGGLRERVLGGASPPRIESVAVLPLANLTGDPAQEYFVDGMTEELITELGKLATLRVISHTSVMRYKNTNEPLPQIARELDVDAVIEGSVSQAGDRVRITANLLYAPSDRHLWAETYERSRRDVLSLQDEVARAIANQIRVKLTPQEQRQFAKARRLDPEAHKAYLMGRYQWSRRTEESVKRSIEYFQKAIEKDPGYASAYAGLADSYAIEGDNGFRRPRDVFPMARAAAMRAVELDPSLAEAHTSLGSVMKAYDWDFPGAERELRRAIELNPNYSTAHQFYGELLESLGRYPEAIAELKRARQLDPFAPRIHGILAWILYLARRYDEGLEAVQKGIEVDPHHAVFFSDRGEIYLQKGMYEQALADYRRAVDLLPGPYYPYFGLLRAYAVSGRGREARKGLDELNDVSKRRYVMPTLVAVAYAELGDKQKAFAWLEKAYKQRDPWLGLTLRSEPGFDSLRSDPRYRDLVRRMKFPS